MIQNDPHTCSLGACEYVPDDRGSWSCRICGRHIEDDDSFPTDEEAAEDMRVYGSHKDATDES
jgi:hypothetical protein